MATLDETNIFGLPLKRQYGLEPEQKAPISEAEQASRQEYEQLIGSDNRLGLTFEGFLKAKERKKVSDQRKAVAQALAEGDTTKAYEGFTELPMVTDQFPAYMTPVLGNIIDEKERRYFGEKAGRQFKDPRDIELEMLMASDPRDVKQYTEQDPVAGAMSTLAGASSLIGIGEGPSLVKAGIMGMFPSLRKGMTAKTMDGQGGGIGGLSKEEFKKREIQRYAREGSGLEYSPTIKGLIEKAPKNLKGKSLTQWMQSNPALAKPKELEYLKVDGENLISFIENNPQMPVNEIIEKASLNKPILRDEIEYYNDPSDYDNALDYETDPEFDINIITEDPLDSSRFADRYDDLIKEDLDSYKQDLADHYFETRTLTTPTNDFDFEKMLQELEGKQQSGFSNETIDDIISEYADELQAQNPVELITPTGNIADLSDRAFAIGNMDDGFSIYIDGEIVDTGTDFIGSQNEAQIQLTRALEDQELFERVSDNTQYKRYIDDNLPGGSGYREMYYPVTYQMKQELGTSNAPNLHFGNDVVFSAIARNRKLADGKFSLHMDEIQSDVHQRANSPVEEGSKIKYGYRTPERIAETQKKAQPFVDEANATLNELLPQLSELKSIAQNKLNEIPVGATNVDGTASYNLMSEVFDVFNEHLSYFATIPDYYNSMKLDSSAMKLTGFLGGTEVARLRGELAQKFNIFQEARDEADDILNSLKKAEPNYPYKDNWYKKTIDKVLLQAIEDGEDAISISASYPVVDRYSGQGREFKEKLYDELAPAYLKKLANKFGGKYEVGSLDIDNTFGSGTEKFLPQPETGLDRRRDLTKAYILKITPEMKKKITEEGLSSFALGGKVSKYTSMDKPIQGNRREI